METESLTAKPEYEYQESEYPQPPRSMALSFIGKIAYKRTGHIALGCMAAFVYTGIRRFDVSIDQAKHLCHWA